MNISALTFDTTHITVLPTWAGNLLTLIFWISVVLIIHTYLLYPLLLYYLARRKTLPENRLNPDENLPFISVIMAAHNEEKVLHEKLKSILNNSYPSHQFEIIIGTDACTDNTNSIIDDWKHKAPVRHYPFDERTGKAGIINLMVEKARGDILIMTDANVYFDKNLMVNLVRHFKDPDIELVGANIINTNIKADGISYQERTYLLNENKIKYREGVLWGAMIGAFGGCYAIRKSAYSPVPRTFFMDDFYITMKVLEADKKAILDLDAQCREDISNIIYEEFRRKIRISIGNYQNLSVFWKKLNNPFTGRGFAFLSHKVIRWVTPFLLLAAFLSSGLLALQDSAYLMLFLFQLFLMIMPFTDFCLRIFNIHSVILRFITHFYSMNLALLIGFFKFQKGVTSNVWEPTKRFQ